MFYHCITTCVFKELNMRSMSLYKQIKKEIVHQIESEALLPGDVLPTRTDLAERYNTAVATVDRALQDLVREGVVKAGSGRRTVVASPVISQTDSITVLCNWPREQTEVSADFLNPLFQGINQACMEFKLQVHYRTSNEAEIQLPDLPTHSGLLVIRPNYSDLPYLESILEAGKPVIAVPGILNDDRVPSLSSDNFMGIEQAVSFLVQLGHSKIGFCSLTATVPDHFERLQGYLSSMSKHNLELSPEWIKIVQEQRPERFSAHVTDWLEKDNLPTALISSDFLITLAVIRRLNFLNVRVPEDISLICFDDPPAAAHLDPALTAVRQNIPLLGYRAVEYLIKGNQDKSLPLTHRIPTELILRDSTTAPQ